MSITMGDTLRKEKSSYLEEWVQDDIQTAVIFSYANDAAQVVLRQKAQ